MSVVKKELPSALPRQEPGGTMVMPRGSMRADMLGIPSAVLGNCGECLGTQGRPVLNEGPASGTPWRLPIRVVKDELCLEVSPPWGTTGRIDDAGFTGVPYDFRQSFDPTEVVAVKRASLSLVPSPTFQSV